MLDQCGNRLVEFLSTSFRAVGDVMRTNRRHDSSARALVSWSGRGQDRTVRARLLDISRAGTGLLTAEPPPLAARVRLRLVGHDPTPWIEAEVLGWSRGGGDGTGCASSSSTPARTSSCGPPSSASPARARWGPPPPADGRETPPGEVRIGDGPSPIR